MPPAAETGYRAGVRAGLTGLWTAAVAATAVAVLAVAAVLAAHQPDPPVRRTRAVLSGEPLPVAPPSDSAGGVPWWWLLIALALALLAGAMLWFVFRDGIALSGRGQVDDELRLREDEQARLVAELGASTDLALADAADELAAGADAREVVVACWVRIERAAEAAGLGRRPAETATNVARRWLAGSPDRAAVDDLAALYHLARYSTHVMTDADRDRARTALRGVTGVPA